MDGQNEHLLRIEGTTPDWREIVQATAGMSPREWIMMVDAATQMVMRLDTGESTAARSDCNVASFGSIAVQLMYMLQADMHAGTGKLAENILVAIEALQADHERRSKSRTLED